MTAQTECHQHGNQDETFVCQHIVHGLREGVAYGFWWETESGSSRPDAWCTACEELVAAADGERTEEVVAFASIKLLCGLCYDRAKEMNIGPNHETG